MSKRIPRTTLSKLTGPILLSERDMARAVGGAGPRPSPQPSKICSTPPQDPDDIFRMDDH